MTVQEALKDILDAHEKAQLAIADGIKNQAFHYHRHLQEADKAEKRAETLITDENVANDVAYRNTVMTGVTIHTRKAAEHRHTIIALVEVARASELLTQEEIDACYHRGREEAGCNPFPVNLIPHAPGNDHPIG